MNLSELAPHNSGTVLHVHGTGAVRQRLLDMGIGKGARITVVRAAPLNDPIEIHVCGTLLALRRTEAEMVEIRPDEPQDHKVSQAQPRIALAGNPNCGKTSLFNRLTGADCEVGNFPGVTVEYTIGTSRIGDRTFSIVDLPGTYSLTAYSIDEIVARDYLLKEKPDILINVLDASILDRQLYLTVQLIELRLPMVIALNMKDIAERHGIIIDTEKLSRILGVPVVMTNAGSDEGLEDLKKACLKVAEQKEPPRELEYSHELEGLIDPVEEALRKHTDKLPAGFPLRWLALKILERDSEYEYLARDNEDVAAARKKTEAALKTHSGEEPSIAISEARLGIASGIVMDCVKSTKPNRRTISDRIDAVACGRWTGPIVLAGVVYLLFLFIFGIAEDIPWIPLFNGEWVSPVQLFEMAFESLGDYAGNMIQSPVLKSLICNGVIAGVGGVLVYVPLIFVMFFCIAILEDTGYIARVAFILDRVLRVFGLQGKSILSMIIAGGLGGGGCAVPGIMAARTLREEKDRLITIMVTPMMNCGAKFPLYVLLTGAFFARCQGLMMFLIWALSWVFSMTAACLLRKIVFRGEQTPFIMELPVYHVPKMRGVFRHTWMRTWQYIRKAGTIILALTVIIWAFMYFPGPDAEVIEKKRIEIEKTTAPESAERQKAMEEFEAFEQSERFRNSFAAKIGNAIVPVSRLAGFTWRENVALLGGFAAKEIVVGTLSTAYSMDKPSGVDQSGKALETQLRQDSSWSALKAFVMILFVMLYSPCAAAIAVIYRETGSLRWTLFSIAYSTTFAFCIAVAVYQIGGFITRLF